MLSSIAARTCLTLALLAAGSDAASAWWDRCDCDRRLSWGPTPLYIYVPRRAPVWTSNGWTYPSVGYYLVPPPDVPYAVYYRPRPYRVRPVW
jgi:hypothetical protein